MATAVNSVNRETLLKECYIQEQNGSVQNKVQNCLSNRKNRFRSLRKEAHGANSKFEMASHRETEYVTVLHGQMR